MHPNMHGCIKRTNSVWSMEKHIDFILSKSKNIVVRRMNPNNTVPDDTGSDTFAAASEAGDFWQDTQKRVHFILGRNWRTVWASIQAQQNLICSSQGGKVPCGAPTDRRKDGGQAQWQLTHWGRWTAVIQVAVSLQKRSWLKETGGLLPGWGQERCNVASRFRLMGWKHLDTNKRKWSHRY